MDASELVWRTFHRIPRPILRALNSPSLLLPGVRIAMRVIEADREIARLEARGDHDAARRARQAAFAVTPAAFAAPLWRSEGYDLLRQGRDREALAAFERVIAVADDFEKRPDLRFRQLPAFFFGDGYGQLIAFLRAEPYRVHYGAACAALGLGDLEKARRYYRRTTWILTVLDRSSSKSAEWWHVNLERMRVRLGEPPP